MRRIIIFALLLVAAIIAAIIVWKWTFTKSDVSMASKKADVEITADVLYNEYENNEEAANASYLGKVIAVSGLVSTISVEGQDILLYLKNEDAMSGVMCAFNKASLDTSRIKVGQQVTIKGICDGYLMDVKLNKCSLEK